MKRLPPIAPDPPLNAIVTDMWATEGASNMLDNLTREELEYVVIGACAYLEALAGAVASQSRMTLDEFWQKFCLNEAAGDQP